MPPKDMGIHSNRPSRLGAEAATPCCACGAGTKPQTTDDDRRGTASVEVTLPRRTWSIVGLPLPGRDCSNKCGTKCQFAVRSSHLWLKRLQPRGWIEGD